MTRTQLIKKVEKQIAETKSLITNYKNQIADHENLLQSLINQLTEIKLKINTKQK